MSTNYVEEASFIEEEGILAFADEEKVDSVNQAKSAVSGAEKSSTDVAEETAAGEEKPAVGDAETVHTHLAPKDIAPDQKAIVEEEIRPGESGRVRFQSSWWPATSDQEITFKPGEAVRVIAIDNVTLIVEG
ncbi:MULTISPECIES: NfeD family protein [unclassified Microcoleus]|uniref:NfeD family protein n=1 Tax=unclassified Microcoleus TaxID=2642155 RepID=UPI0025CBA95D|nr:MULTISPECIES: NfeD family protein [unclassified Microcoleus]